MFSFQFQQLTSQMVLSKKIRTIKLNQATFNYDWLTSDLIRLHYDKSVTYVKIGQVKSLYRTSLQFMGESKGGGGEWGKFPPKWPTDR